MTPTYSCPECARSGIRYCECPSKPQTQNGENEARCIDGHGNHSAAEAARLQLPLPKGQPVWLVVNGAPALRYYLRPQGRGHILTFAPDQETGVYYDRSDFYSCQSAILVRQVAGLQNQIASLQKDLAARRAQLQASLEEEAKAS